MMKRSLLWQIYPAVLVIVILAMLLTYGNVSRVIRDFYRTEMQQDLEARARLISDQFIDPIRHGNRAGVQELVQQLGQRTETRITVIDLNGRVLGESQENPLQMENHLTRPEVQQALEEGVGHAVRPSTTLEQDMMYVALRLDGDGRPVAVLRTAAAMGDFDAALRQVLHRIIRAAIIVAVVLAAVSWLVMWRIAQPLRQIRRGARRFARGDLDHRLPIPNTAEMAAVSTAMNRMAEELSRRIETITRQRNEQQAVLSSMAEGVLAVDAGNRCISINLAAAGMLQPAVTEPVGRLVGEVVRNEDLQAFIARALDCADPIETQLVIPQDGRERHLQAHGTALTDGQGRRIGAVIVLNDITELHKLQMVRTDFVANVSHELKTPVTSIKGFIETLLDGAAERPEDRRRFLAIIARQTERLNSIIDDLLTLSRIEQQADTASIPLEDHALRGLLLETVELCEHRAAKKNITLDLRCEEDLRASINPSLLQQALVNLIDNAVKYSEPRTTVEIQARRAGEAIEIAVKDSGCGISKEHLPRLFERFFRVDKARSRKLGGTGLGLAIVKHIVQAHNGTISIDSTPGQGSTFTLRLPLR